MRDFTQQREKARKQTKNARRPSFNLLLRFHSKLATSSHKHYSITPLVYLETWYLDQLLLVNSLLPTTLTKMALPRTPYDSKMRRGIGLVVYHHQVIQPTPIRYLPPTIRKMITPYTAARPLFTSAAWYACTRLLPLEVPCNESS